MQLDSQSVNNTLSIIGGGVIALAATLGVGNLLLAVYQRWAKKREEEGAMHDTINTKRIDADEAVRGKQIDADQAAFVIVSERLKLVEARIDTLQADLSDQREMNARKDQKIEHLEKDNTELRAEVDTLRKDRRQQDIVIAELRSELNALKIIVESGGHVMDQPIDVRLVETET